MHLKTLRNFLLLVLCTIGIGFASAPSAAAAITLTNLNTGAVLANTTTGDGPFAYGFGAVTQSGSNTIVNSDYTKNGCLKVVVKVDKGGAAGSVKPAITIIGNGGNSSLINELKVHRIASDATSETFALYYIPANNRSKRACQVYIYMRQ